MEARDVKLELDASALIGGFQYVAPSKLVVLRTRLERIQQSSTHS